MSSRRSSSASALCHGGATEIGDSRVNPTMASSISAASSASRASGPWTCPGSHGSAVGWFGSSPASAGCRQCRRTRRGCGSSNRSRCLERSAPCRRRRRPPSRRKSPPGSAPDSTDCGSGRTARCWCWRRGEFRRVGLGEHDSAGRFEPAHDFRVLGRHIILEQRRCEGGADAGGRRDVLDRRSAGRAAGRAARPS